MLPLHYKVKVGVGICDVCCYFNLHAFPRLHCGNKDQVCMRKIHAVFCNHAH